MKSITVTPIHAHTRSFLSDPIGSDMQMVQQNGRSTMDTLRLGAMMSILDQRKGRAYYTSIYETFNTNSHFKYTVYTVRYFLAFTLLADERRILMDKSEVFPKLKFQFIYLLF